MLKKRLAVYVPSKVGQEELPVSTRDFWLKNTLRTLAEVYGGATMVEGHGAWLGADGEVVLEKVTIVYTYTTEDADTGPVYSLAQRLAAALRQEAVAIEVDNCMDFVTADAESVAV